MHQDKSYISTRTINAIPAFIAIMLIILIPLINRIYLGAHYLSHLNHHSETNLDNQQTKSSPNTISDKYDIAIKQAFDSYLQQQHSPDNQLMHDYLCEYCVLAAHLLPLIVLLIIFLNQLKFHFLNKLRHFAIWRMVINKEHPPRAGPFLLV